MTRFIAFDVETPNRLNNRISAIGISVIEDGRIVENIYSLVNPEISFDSFNVRLTGINESMVRDAPNFNELWAQIRPVMESGMLVAHNAVFDMGVLSKCLNAYNIAWRPYARYLCTVQMGRRLLPDINHKLNNLCDYYGISLDHHHADSDSRACAEILLRYIEDGADIKQYIRTYNFENRKANIMAGNIKYEIIKEIGIISEGSKGWRKELNLISWNDAAPKYDLRDWAPDHAKMGKGVTLTADELKKLGEIIGGEIDK